jgi:hypothetical protein
MTYYECSAKTNMNVEPLFKTLSGQMKEKFAREYIEKYKKTKTCLMPIKPVTDPKVGRKTTCC